MRLKFAVSLISFGLAGSLWAQAPQMTRVQPDNGAIGACSAGAGVYLGKPKWTRFISPDHTMDMKVKVLAQTDDAIEFRIPPSVKTRPLCKLLVKTAGKQAVLVGAAVFITVDEQKRGRSSCRIEVVPPGGPGAVPGPIGPSPTSDPSASSSRLRTARAGVAP